ncbi:hypothetical protein H5410_002695, partial [Solanum commersonii]
KKCLLELSTIYDKECLPMLLLIYRRFAWINIWRRYFSMTSKGTIQESSGGTG